MYICKIFTFFIGINLFFLNSYVYCDAMLRKFDNPFLYREVIEKEQESKSVIVEPKKSVETEIKYEEKKDQSAALKEDNKNKHSGVRSCSASGCVDFD